MPLALAMIAPGLRRRRDWSARSGALVGRVGVLVHGSAAAPFFCACFGTHVTQRWAAGKSNKLWALLTELVFAYAAIWGSGGPIGSGRRPATRGTCLFWVGSAEAADARADRLASALPSVVGARQCWVRRDTIRDTKKRLLRVLEAASGLPGLTAVAYRGLMGRGRLHS